MEGGSLTQRLEEAVAPLLEQHGYDLILIEYVPRSRVLRLYIDRIEAQSEVDTPAQTQAGVTIDDCSRVSHMVGDLLDAEGLVEGPGGIGGQYTLEVSSPGLDRPLVRPRDFRRFVGHRINVTTRELLEDGRRKVSGQLTAADDRGIRVDAEGRPFEIGYGLIERARLVPEL